MKEKLEMIKNEGLKQIDATTSTEALQEVRKI